MLIQRVLPPVTAILVLIFSCKKNGPVDDIKKDSFHTDIVIRETIRGAEQSQNTLLLQSPLIDVSKLISISSRGIYENEAEGYRFISLQKDSGIVVSKSFTVSSAYTYQFATCAMMDKSDNVWVAGHLFGGANSYGKPFVAKLNSSGVLLFSRMYPAFDQNNNPVTFRTVGITGLANGNILLITFSVAGYQLVKLDSEGNIVWRVFLNNNSPDPFYQNPFDVTPNISNIINIAAELSDGSIVLHAFRKQGGAKDYLIKIDANGNLLFAKRFIYEPAYPSSSAQLIALPGDKILWVSQKRGVVSGHPYVYVLSSNGQLLKAKGFSINATISNPFEINEAKYIDGKIFLTTTGGYQFASYTLDDNLLVIDSKKILGTNTVSTDRGGLSAYDPVTKSMYHIIDVSGQLGEGNGFQYIKTDAMGKSCHPYSIPPEQLTLNDINVLVENEPSIIVLPAFRMEVNNFNWNISNFVVESQDKVCEN
jgi:hypothetical protein